MSQAAHLTGGIESMMRATATADRTQRVLAGIASHQLAILEPTTKALGQALGINAAAVALAAEEVRTWHACCENHLSICIAADTNRVMSVQYALQGSRD